MTELKTVYCSVCGQGSTRLDWQDKTSPVCDSHSKEEIAAAAKTTPPTPPASPASSGSKSSKSSNPNPPAAG